jgi:hypothetical protein
MPDPMPPIAVAAVTLEFCLNERGGVVRKGVRKDDVAAKQGLAPLAKGPRGRQ